MNNRVFVTSDTHFGHSNILKFVPARAHFKDIDEHNETLVENWNRVVKPKDTVYHLGDVLFGVENFKYLERLNGLKKLVMGNHDHYPTTKYLEYFEKVAGCVKTHGCILSHIPVHSGQLDRFVLNLHGHLHQSKLDDTRYINCCVEHHNLTPVLLESLL